LNGMRCVTHGQVSVWSHRCGYIWKLIQDIDVRGYSLIHCWCALGRIGEFSCHEETFIDFMDTEGTLINYTYPVTEHHELP